jgi:hypothetical protein
VTDWNFNSGVMNCQHTSNGGWWTANFEEESSIKTVRIYKRTDCCGDRATMTVKVGDHQCLLKEEKDLYIDYDCNSTLAH